jgi:hypothetical protein
MRITDDDYPATANKLEHSCSGCALIKILIFSIALTIAPFLPAVESQDVAAETAARPSLQSMFIVSDFVGTLSLNGLNMGPVKEHAEKFLEIDNLSPGDYELILRVNSKIQIYCDAAIDRGKDTYVYLRNGECRTGHALSQIDYHPPHHDGTLITLEALS